ncbi:DNA double-strand break repair nuclease NurA, partial [Halobium palmae]
AAMASVPTDLDLHRRRSQVATVHTRGVTANHELDWTTYDDDYGRLRVLHAPRVNRYAEGVVHALSLYLSESSHALEHAEAVDDLLLLDGPLYPKELLNWQDRDAELGELVREAKPRAIVENYVRLVEEFVERDVPLAGFVKNPSAKLVTRTVGEHGVEAPWVDDTALFTRLLERRPLREVLGKLLDQREEPVLKLDVGLEVAGTDRAVLVTVEQLGRPPAGVGDCPDL